MRELLRNDTGDSFAAAIYPFPGLTGLTGSFTTLRVARYRPETSEKHWTLKSWF